MSKSKNKSQKFQSCQSTPANPYEISVDWLSFTYKFDPTPLTKSQYSQEPEIVSALISSEIKAALLMLLNSAMPSTLVLENDLDFDGGLCASSSLSILDLGKGLFGYTDSANLILEQDGDKLNLGSIAWGGASQKGKVYCSLNSTGVKYLDLTATKTALNSVSARITRVDIALDDFFGAHTVGTAMKAYQSGLFTTGGKKPNAKLIYDCGCGTGNTFYVGGRNAKKSSETKSTQASKMLRVYQKGKQLGDSKSKWVRFELELHSDKSIVPYDVLTDLKSFFLGAYGWLDSTFNGILNGISKKIPKISKLKTEIKVYDFLDNFSKQYGKLFTYLDHCGLNSQVFLAMIKREGMPKRFKTMAHQDFSDAVYLAFQNGVLID